MFSFVGRIVNKARVFLSHCITRYRCAELAPVEVFDAGNFVVRGAVAEDIDRLRIIYRKLNGLELSSLNIKLLKKHPQKLVLLAEISKNGERVPVGMDMFYLNPRDFQEDTIHEGFIGVLPDHEGQGIASQMRKQAIEHFKQNGFKGISTRISKTNFASLNSARKLGFKVVEKYFDAGMNECRYYLICTFNESDS